MPSPGLRSAYRLVRDAYKDTIVRVFSPSIRASVIHATGAAEEARRRFDVGLPHDAALLANGICASTALASFYKGQERVAVGMSAGGAELYTESIRVGEVRGYLRGLQHLRSGKFDTNASSASFSVNKILYNMRRPVQSNTPLSHGNVIGDLREWYARSEQVPAVVHSEVRCRSKDGREAHFINGELSGTYNERAELESCQSDEGWYVTFAGGAILELMPGGSAAELAMARNLLGHALLGYYNDIYNIEEDLPEQLLREVLRLPAKPKASASSHRFTRRSIGSGAMSPEEKAKETAEAWAEEEAQAILGKYRGTDPRSLKKALGPFSGIGINALKRAWAGRALYYRHSVARTSSKAAGILQAWKDGDLLAQIKAGRKFEGNTESINGSYTPEVATTMAYGELARVTGRRDTGPGYESDAGVLETLIKRGGATPQEVAGLLVPWSAGGICDLESRKEDGSAPAMVLGGYPWLDDEPASASYPWVRGKAADEADSIADDAGASEAADAADTTHASESAMDAEEEDGSALAGAPVSTPLHYLCRCSKAGFLTRLASLPEEELITMVNEAGQKKQEELGDADGGDAAAPAVTEHGEGDGEESEQVAETLICRVCNEHYPITKADLHLCIDAKRQAAEAARIGGSQGPAGDGNYAGADNGRQ